MCENCERYGNLVDRFTPMLYDMDRRRVRALSDLVIAEIDVAEVAEKVASGTSNESDLLLAQACKAQCKEEIANLDAEIDALDAEIDLAMSEFEASLVPQDIEIVVIDIGGLDDLLGVLAGGFPMFEDVGFDGIASGAFVFAGGQPFVVDPDIRA